MPDTRLCPTCGNRIPSGSPAGLCPKCLLHGGIDSQSEVDPNLTPTRQSPPTGTSSFVPPSVEELAPLFPQLEILELLGKGGMGAVYKARQPGLDRLVALKILPPEISRDPAFAGRFQREARALARLSHPHIVAVYDFGQTDSARRGSPDPAARSTEGLLSSSEPQETFGQPGGSVGDRPQRGLCYIVMEFVDGANLRQAIQTKTLTSAEALAIVPQICEALQFAHDEGIVHRDIKPENILIDKRGRVKIADFGLAKLLGTDASDHSLTASHQVMGTLRYMAPEQMQGSREVDHRADIYSLGVVFYELLTGELPMGRFAPPSKRVQVDVRLDEVVLRALEQDPEQRYQHASEVKQEVETIRSGPIQRSILTTTSEPVDRLRELANFWMSPQPGFGKWVGWPMLVLLAMWMVATAAVHVVYGQKDNYREGPILLAQGGGMVLLPLAFFALLANWSVRQRVVADAARRPVHFFEGPWCSGLFGIVSVLSAVSIVAVAKAKDRLDSPSEPATIGFVLVAAVMVFLLWVAGRTRWAATERPSLSRRLTHLVSGVLLLVLSLPPVEKLPLVEAIIAYRRHVTFALPQEVTLRIPPVKFGEALAPGESPQFTKTTGKLIRLSEGIGVVETEEPIPSRDYASWSLMAFLATGEQIDLRPDFPEKPSSPTQLGTYRTQCGFHIWQDSIAPTLRTTFPDRQASEHWSIVLLICSLIALHRTWLPIRRMLGIAESATAMVAPPASVARPESSKGVESRPAVSATPFDDSRRATQPRFSRFAIAGAVWAFFGLLAIIPTLYFIGLNRVWNGTALPTDVIHSEPPIAFTIFMGALLVIGSGAPIGTTIYGAVAIARIKRSEGQIVGLPLAVADTIFFPLLALFVGFAFIVAQTIVSVTHWKMPTAEAPAALVALVVCFFVARAVWRAIAGPSAQPQATARMNEATPGVEKEKTGKEKTGTGPISFSEPRGIGEYVTPPPSPSIPQTATDLLPRLTVTVIAGVAGGLTMAVGVALAAFAVLTESPNSGVFWGWMGGAFGCFVGGGGALIGAVNSYRQLAGAADLMTSSGTNWLDRLLQGYGLLGCVALVVALTWNTLAPPARYSVALLGSIMVIQAVWMSLVRASIRQK